MTSPTDRDVRTMVDALDDLDTELAECARVCHGNAYVTTDAHAEAWRTMASRLADLSRRARQAQP